MSRAPTILCAAVLCCVAAAAAGARAGDEPTAPATREVVVTLRSPPVAGRRGAAGRAARRHLEAEQARFIAALHEAVPQAHVRWRYSIVLNGAAVVLPRTAISRLKELPGVKTVDAPASYMLSATTPATKSAAVAATWQTGLPNRGDGIKIGFIDDGIDQRHPYFSPAGYAMPAGFPKGQAAYTTAKVIVARAFAPPGSVWRNAGKPFDPLESEHATHVAGIAAGNSNTLTSTGSRVSGVAPRAYIGNYKALTIPTDAGVGIDGNAAEIVAAIEAAVSDGMDVINLSIGEPDIEPSHDIVATALDGAAAAGVVPVVAAGNDFEEFGQGSLTSPGSSAMAITVAAVTSPAKGETSSLAGFSSAGPTPLALRLKPDLSAPGVSILSSVPDGEWETFSGTSMATPQIAGAAALLLERHPTWSVSDIKAALIGSGTLVKVDGKPAPPTRGGGGLANPAKADAPLVLATPPSVSFGLVHPGDTASAPIELTDVGDGAGNWDVTVESITAPAGARLDVPATVAVPGTLDLEAVVNAGAAEGDLTGFVRLTRGADVRRIPFWLRVTRPALSAAKVTALRSPGLYLGNTRGKPSLVSRYRYPDVPVGGAVAAVLRGPEQVFRFALTKQAVNFGVAIVKRSKGSGVQPRVVVAGDENQLTGYAALPVNLNPYLSQFDDAVLAAGAIRPLPGNYDIVFDSPTSADAGSYTFRFWVNDTRPPAAKVAKATVTRGEPLVVTVTDAGSGVDSATAKVLIDGDDGAVTPGPGTSSARTFRISSNGLSRGTHALRFQVSDYQESRNMENVPPILPNTRVLRARIVIR